MGRKLRIPGALLLLVILSGCIAPAFNAKQYRHKASEATDQAASALALVEQAVTQAARHHLYLPPVEVAVADASEVVESVSGAMASVKPPDDSSAGLREKVLDLLDRAEQAASNARIALQRGQIQEAEKAAEEAGPLVDELEALSMELEK
jgi:hypothetical protein